MNVSGNEIIYDPADQGEMLQLLRQIDEKLEILAELEEEQQEDPAETVSENSFDYVLKVLDIQTKQDFYIGTSFLFCSGILIGLLIVVFLKA